MHVEWSAVEDRCEANSGVFEEPKIELCNIASRTPPNCLLDNEGQRLLKKPM